MNTGTSPLLLDIKVNALLYAGVAIVFGGICYHYPAIFTEKADRAAMQSKVDEKAEWACAAIEGGHPLLVEESGTPIALKDGAKYYGAGKLGSDMLPIPAGTVLRDSIGNAGIMVATATGDTVFRYRGGCPGLASKPGVTTMGTYFEGRGR